MKSEQSSQPCLRLWCIWISHHKNFQNQVIQIFSKQKCTYKHATQVVTQQPLIATETVVIFHNRIKILTSHSSGLHTLTLPLIFPASPSISYDPAFLSYITWPDTEVRRSCIINTTPALLTVVTVHQKKLLIFYHIHKLKQSRKYINLTADMPNLRVFH